MSSAIGQPSIVLLLFKWSPKENSITFARYGGGLFTDLAKCNAIAPFDSTLTYLLVRLLFLEGACPTWSLRTR